MPKVEYATRGVVRLIGVLVAILILTSCAERGFQWPWAQKPVTTTDVPPAPPPPQPATESDIRQIQAGLTKLGYRPGPTDGKYGRRTKGAILQYQRAHDLPEDGQTTLALLVHIETTLAEKPRRRKARKAKSRETSAKMEAVSKQDVASKHEATAKQTKPAPRLPLAAYTRGSEYIYQNGEVDRVESVKEGEIKWRRGDKEYSVSAPNFLLPAKYWETSKKRGKAVLTGGDNPIWPSRMNETKSYMTVQTVMDRADETKMTTVEESWTCANEGRMRLTVPAGTFETVRLVCTRAEIGDIKSARRIWHYAPAIRHYVRLEEFTKDQRNARRRELVAIRPGALQWPPVARAALEQRLIAALDESAIGSNVEWNSSGTSTEVTVKMMSEYFDAMGRQCRRYRQIWLQGSREYHYPGVACRDKSGKWRLPVDARAAPAVLAVASRSNS